MKEIKKMLGRWSQYWKGTEGLSMFDRIDLMVRNVMWYDFKVSFGIKFYTVKR